ncbi:MAG TPA: zf-HC2 domain-containing protein [Chthonomonadaceae bacterium]|nr:zf-HC2 domain-containing protein [Chthonomonadaceae bacterium]
MQKLSDYMDGALGTREATRLREHLASCAACREEYEALLALRKVLHAAPTPVVRSGFWQHIELTLRTHSPLGRRVPLFSVQRSWTWAVAGMLLLGTIIWVRGVHAPASKHEKKTMVAQVFPKETSGTVSMDAIVSLHTRMSAAHPLADAGRLRYLDSDSEKADLQDGKLDIR